MWTQSTGSGRKKGALGRPELLLSPEELRSADQGKVSNGKTPVFCKQFPCFVWTSVSPLSTSQPLELSLGFISVNGTNDLHSDSRLESRQRVQKRMSNGLGVLEMGGCDGSGL
jgi:hypothetical protein